MTVCGPFNTLVLCRENGRQGRPSTTANSGRLLLPGRFMHSRAPIHIAVSVPYYHYASVCHIHMYVDLARAAGVSAGLEEYMVVLGLLCSDAVLNVSF